MMNACSSEEKTIPTSPQYEPLVLWGGVECTLSRVGDVYRDQCQLSGHNERPDDLSRLAGLGIKALRYPLLWETFAASPDREGLWAWHAARLNHLRAVGVRPILGLVHHGSGPPGTSLLHADFAPGVAAHAAQAARRFPWVTDWTPINEPLTTARFAALYGHWYPHMRDERAFWLALLNQIDAVRLSMSAIRAVNPAARLIQTEDLGFTQATPERAAQAEFDNHRRWAGWDLLCGALTRNHIFWQHLSGLGLADRVAQIADAPCPPDVIGVNHYLTSDRFLDHRLNLYPPATHGLSAHGPLADVEAVRVVEQPCGLAGALRSAWERYTIPLALTEVHVGCTREEQMRWLRDAWETATQLRAQGVAIEAVTVWSLFGAYDWNSLLTRQDGHHESGTFDVRGPAPRETALAPLIRTLAKGVPPTHPVLDGQAWWQRPERFHLPLCAPTLASPARKPQTRPILIVGATGTLGQAFAGACQLRNIHHVVARRDQLDLCDTAQMSDMLDGVRPWAVINCAGWVRVDEAEHQAQDCLAANVTGCVALARACVERDMHYSCFSSDLVFDGVAGRAYVERDRPAPLNVYGQSKARAEDAILALGSRALIIRTASFFSPYDQHNFAVHVAAALRAGQCFRAVEDCITSPTYVPDLVRTTLDLIIDDETGLWHLTNEGALSWAAFAQAIGTALALDIRLIEPVRIAEMAWPAQRPLHAPLTSERGLLMPELSCAIARFAAELG